MLTFYFLEYIFRNAKTVFGRILLEMQQIDELFLQAEDELGSVLARLGGDHSTSFLSTLYIYSRRELCIILDIDNIVV